MKQNRFLIGSIIWVNKGHTIFGAFDRSDFKEDDQVVIRKYVLKAKEVTISVDTTGDQGRPEFTVFTNLPKKTIVTMTLENGSGYSQTEEVELDKEGKGKSNYFSQGTAALPLAGEYTLTVTMSPQKQPSKVQDEIGAKGETLSGSCIKTDEASGEKYVHYEMEYKSPYSQGEIDDATKQKSFEDVIEMVQEHMENSSEDPNTHYTVVPDSGGINVTIWSDGVSVVATAAKMGDKSSRKTWKKLTKNTRRASITLQGYLDDNGYTDKTVVLNIANENDLDKVLYQASRGTTLYDVMD